MSQRIILRSSNLTRLGVRVALELGRRAAPRIRVQDLLGLLGWRLRGSPLEALECFLVFGREARGGGARCDCAGEAGEAGEETEMEHWLSLWRVAGSGDQVISR